MVKISFFIFNIFFNSFLAFITAFLLIEGIIFLLRIPQGRIKAYLRMIPIIKLPLDIFFYDFSNWIWGFGYNPLHLEEGTRTLVASIGVTAKPLIIIPSSSIQLLTSEHLSFSFGDLIAFLTPTFFRSAFAHLIVLTSLIFLSCKIYKYIKFKKSLYKKRKALKINKKFKNEEVAHLLKKKEKIYCLSSQNSPFIFGIFSSAVYFPRYLLNKLTLKEIEAVFLHEIAHIRYRDCFVKLFLEILRSIFWWIPIKFTLRAIEDGFETSADIYGLGHRSYLASAIYKLAKDSKPFFALSSFSTKKRMTRRISFLLNFNSSKRRIFQKILLFFAIILSFFVLLGRYWIF